MLLVQPCVCADSLQTVLLLDDEDDGSGVPPLGGVMSSADSHDKIGKKRSVKAVLSSQLLSLKTTSGWVWVCIVVQHTMCTH